MLHELQSYMVHEYVADYKAGYLLRRDLVRRVLNITGGLGTTATLLLAMGCSAQPAAPTTAPAASSISQECWTRSGCTRREGCLRIITPIWERGWTAVAAGSYTSTTKT